MIEWVKVTDRLPPRGYENYLAVIADDNEPPSRFVTITMFYDKCIDEKGRWRFTSDSHVTHWTELPELPELLELPEEE